MLKFNATAFYTATSVLQYISTMLTERGLDEHKKSDDGSVVVRFIDDPTLVGNMRTYAKDLQSSLLTLGTRQTCKSVDRLITTVNGARFTFPDVVALHREIDSRLKDELSDITLLTLTPSEQGYFVPPKPLFGAEFEAKFPSGLFELDEAAKCMSLGRSTAAVFHFMRLMEVGIRAIARSLQIPDPAKPAEKNWAIILKSAWEGIERKWPTVASRMSGDGQVFEALYASLDAVKNPWRNATMHVENKYTDEEAEHIFAAVRGFMRKLSSRMDENGEPKA